MKIEYSYMSGAGNLFSVIDNRKYGFNPRILSFLAKKLCNINDVNTYKTEGLLAVGESVQDDFDVLFYNPDGSSDMMCGNGGRCAVFFAKEFDFIKPEKNLTTFSMSGENYSAVFVDNEVKLFLPPPKKAERNKKLRLDDKQIEYEFYDVQSRHVVINRSKVPHFKDLNKAALKTIMKRIRKHKDFQPEGVNVNVFEKINGKFHLITFEKGVEDITGACGTGAISTAFYIYSNNLEDFPIEIIPPSNKKLTIDTVSKDIFQGNVTLKGHAEITGKNIAEINLEEEFNA